MSTTLPTGPDADDQSRTTPFAGNPVALIPGHEADLLRLEVSGRSIDEAGRLADRIYGQADLRLARRGRAFSFRFASTGDADVSLRLASISDPIEGDVERLEDYVVTWFRDGPGTITTRGHVSEKAPGQPFALPSALPFSFESPAGRHSLVHLSRTFLNRIATERHGGPPQPIAFRHDFDPGFAAVTAWRRVMAEMTPVITGTEVTPLVRMESDLAIARSVLDVFAWNTQQVPPVLLAPRLTRVRIAVEYLHENAHLAIVPADAADAAGIHTRSLQNAFQRHLGTSPTEYLRGIRLDRVRRDLVEHTPSTATVGDLARAWGFGNLGRFSAAYYRRFGQKPNETLRNRHP